MIVLGILGRVVIVIVASVILVVLVLVAVEWSFGRHAGSFLLEVQDGPVKHIVVLESLSVKEFLKEPLEVGVIGAVLKPQGSAVLKVGAEFRGVSLAQLFRAGGHFAVHDALVLLFLGVGLESLPGERPADKVHENIAEGFQIVPTALLNANVGVDRCITGRSGKILVLAVRNVLVGTGIAVLLGQPKVDNVNDRLALAQPNQKIIRLDITMNKGLGVHILQTTQQLIRQHQHRLELKPTSTIIE